MFLVFTLVLLVVAVGILASVYSIFFPFMQNLGTVQQYHTAYYGAVSSVERAELALKYRNPWFVGSGWFTSSECYGPSSDCTVDMFVGSQGLWWEINSRTATIPATGMGNTDPMFAASDSADYNALGYTNLETFLLSYDNTTSGELYYTWVDNRVFFSGESVEGVFRLPSKISSVFGADEDALLCDTIQGDCDPDGDGIYDDPALSRSMEWLYNDEWFKIFPTISVFYYSGMQVDESKDNAIRESIINETGVINLSKSFTPITHGTSLYKHNVVGANASEIEQQDFFTIFGDPHFSDLRLSFGAANLFRTFLGTIYPYLEYKFIFPQAIADRFYTIQWHSRVGEYDVQIVLKKPTVEGTVGGDFTVVF